MCGRASWVEDNLASIVCILCSLLLQVHVELLRAKLFFYIVVVMQYYPPLQNTDQAQGHLKAVFAVLDRVLATKTFLVGERVTLADISCVCDLLLLYKQVSWWISCLTIV